MSRESLAGSLAVADPEAASLLLMDLNRDAASLNLMAAESYPTLAVREACAAPIPGLEGYPGQRYHSGSSIMDKIELLCQQRAVAAFRLNDNEWRVNVQPFSGSLANLYTYVGLLKPGDTILRMELSHGGHLSHGHQLPSREVSETSHRFVSVAYHTSVDTETIDYDEIEALALEHEPQLITTGYSAYCRLIDFARLRNIANKSKMYLHCDMSHICGLIASGLIPSPFVHCDVVTSTTYKTIRGPQAALIFSKTSLGNQIDRTVFPRFQAGISFAKILAIAVALRQLQTEESRIQQQRFLQSAHILAECLSRRGFRLVSRGTDIHMLLIDLRDRQIGGMMAEKVLEMANIICNRNTIPGDDARTCSGLRLATPQMTIRGMSPIQADRIAEFVDRGIKLAQAVSISARIGSSLGQSNSHGDFNNLLQLIEDSVIHQEIMQLQADVAG